MKYLLNAVNPGNHFTDQLSRLFSKYPNALGMKPKWQSEQLWKI